MLCRNKGVGAEGDDDPAPWQQNAGESLDLPRGGGQPMGSMLAGGTKSQSSFELRLLRGLTDPCRDEPKSTPDRSSDKG